MQKTILLLALTFTTFAFGQLKGSGKTITKTYNYKNFDKINFQNLAGNLQVEIGKPFSISVTIDDNLIGFLDFSENKTENQLTIGFKGNENNNMYIENTNIKILVCMPEASVIKNNGNSDLIINNVTGRYFKIENTGNGDTKINGTTDFLDVKKMGNGDVLCQKLMAKKAVVNSAGNGNVIINASNELSATLNGNGDIQNIGAALFDYKSTKTGNGKLINK